jgi:2-hydroxy-3-oxopropionate reductase
MKIGFIGLGIMGKPMAENLMKAGHELVVFDVIAKPVQELAAKSAKAASSSREVAEQCTLIITMVPNSPQVKEVVMGAGGILERMQPGTIIVDVSSINPIASREICAVVEAKGGFMLDAPVSGGEPKAIDGTLSIMVGGNEALFEEYKPLLQTMGTSIVRCGEIGAGNTAKLANQVIVALNIAAVSEAFMLAEKAGVDPHLVFDAIKGGLAGSTVMNAKAPMIIEGNYKPGFKIDLHIKDLNNAIETAHKVGSPMPMTAAVMEILQNLKADGYGQNDHSAIAKFYEKITGTHIGRA